MLNSNYKIKYNGKMDKEVLPLCNALNSLPSIETTESCCGHGIEPLSIWFKVGDDKEGLFFLVRCVDRRYWKYGHLWKMELIVGDMFDNKYLPIYYRLYSGDEIGEQAYDQANSLLENMKLHINNEAFIKGYNLDVEKFKYLIKFL